MGEVAFVALGSNLGNRAGTLAAAVASIRGLPRTRLIAETPVEETAPFGPSGQNPYLNQMVAIDTDLQPHDLLDALQGIERAAGRTRDVRWGPRVLDLDIVRFGGREIDDDRLTVPHPGLRDRDFWQREARQLEALLDG
jgi:2-amino-4-hydroxy-6-hydroxymethyldihydropteridine diphosphokinase